MTATAKDIMDTAANGDLAATIADCSNARVTKCGRGSATTTLSVAGGWTRNGIATSV
jgi:hypothetical protein